jgi:hypothetical protein
LTSGEREEVSREEGMNVLGHLSGLGSRRPGDGLLDPGSCCESKPSENKRISITAAERGRGE